MLSDSRICVQQCFDQGVGLRGQHNPHHTDHVQICNEFTIATCENDESLSLE